MCSGRMGGVVLTRVPLKPLLFGTKMVKGPKFCRGHETEPVGRCRGSGVRQGQRGLEATAH